MQEILTILSNKRLTDTVFEMKLSGNMQNIKKSGQFVNLKLDGLYLRRPISICDYTANTLTIIYKVVGKGTEQMSKMVAGQTIDTLVGLGNGFDISVKTNKPLLIGGGVGTPPMYNLCKKLKEQGKSVTVILGFNTKDEVFYEEEFKAVADKVIIKTADGSYGEKGFVTTNFNHDYDYVFTCGPLPMLKAVYNEITTSGQFSFEERMGCGFGACMGCSCKTKYGNKRICKDGPVLVKEEIIW